MYLKLFEGCFFSFFSPENSLQKGTESKTNSRAELWYPSNQLIKAGFVSVQPLVAGPYGSSLMNSSASFPSVLD